MTITWPVLPAWVSWVTAGSQLAAAMAKLGLVVAGAVLLGRMSGGSAGAALFRREVFWQVATLFGALLLSVAGWTAAAVWTVRRQRKWGSVPRVMTVTPTSIVQEWPGVWRMRRREWPADRVAGVVWRPVTHIFGRRTVVVRVTIRFTAGRPLRFTIDSRDRDVVDRARRGLDDLLGRPASV